MTTPRVLLGNRDGTYGLWVSKPGVDVTTAADADTMLSIDRKALQIVASGVITGLSNGGTKTVTIPDLGFYPFILFSCNTFNPFLKYNSHTSISFYTRTYSYESGGGGATDNTIRYAVTNIDTGL